MLEIAVVGLGGIARKAHLPLLATNPSVRIVGLASRTGQAVSELEGQYRLPLQSRTIEQILSRPPQAAFVLASTESHPEVVCALLDAGVHVYLEKPLASAMEGAEQIVARAERTDRHVMVGFNRRFAPLYIRAKELVPSPSVIQITKHRAGSRFNVLQGLLDDTIHIIDLLRYYGGEPESVSAVISGDPVTITALCRLSGGGTGVISQTYGAGQVSERVELHGGGVSAVVEEMETLRIRTDGRERVEGYQPWTTTLEKRGFVHAHAHFLQSLTNEETPAPSAADSLLSQRLAMRILEAGART